MYFLYSIIYTVGMIVLSPRFLFDAIFNGKYAAGFKQRLGFPPHFDAHGGKVIWLHCVSVGEVNAARPLADALRESFPNYRLVVSTTTKTGQKVARTAFEGIAELVFYFPFDWRFTVRRALRRLTPSVVLLMETELWFNFIREANKGGARVIIVNGRLSERSYKRYGNLGRFIRRVLGYLDHALMQDKADASRLMSLGIRASKVKVTGNMKFDHDLDVGETELTDMFRTRFGIGTDAPLIVAASTHSPEEEWLLAAFKEVWKSSGNNLPRLMIAPRHPERFAEVAELIKNTGFTWVRRSDSESSRDTNAEIILLDSIGELRAAYPLAELVFVGGSLIPHGGQSIFEPAAVGKAIVTGPFTRNFDAAVREFLEHNALVQIPSCSKKDVVGKLVGAFIELLSDDEKRAGVGANAIAVMSNNRGAVKRTIELLSHRLDAPESK